MTHFQGAAVFFGRARRRGECVTGIRDLRLKVGVRNDDYADQHIYKPTFS